MPRLPVIDPETSSGEVKELFAGPFKSMKVNMLKTMANSPATLGAFAGMFGSLSHGLLNGREREAVALAIAEANGCGYCVAAHTAIGRGLGLSEQDALGARRGDVADAKLAALTRFARTIHERKGRVTDEDVRLFRAAGYGDGHIAEVVAHYALAVFTNYFNHVNDTAVDFPVPARV